MKNKYTSTGRRKKNSHKLGFKLIYLIGFTVFIATLLILLVIFIQISIYGGLVLYESNILIQIIEYSFIIFGIIFFIYLFKKIMWDSWELY